jgi:hypothetical protein
MDILRGSPSKHILGIVALVAAGAIFCGPQAGAQQQTPKLSPSFAKAALATLQAIEADTYASQGQDGETATRSSQTAAQKKIVASDAAASTEQEESISKMLHQLYRLRLHDNKVVAAYETLIEIESAQDNSEERLERQRKDLAAAQLADNQEAIEKREEACFWQLEDSLRQRSPRNITACSEWIRREKMVDAGAITPATAQENASAEKTDGSDLASDE